MLGLGNSLTTGSAHEQNYSLLLDGTGDYLQSPSSIEGSNFPQVTGTLSLWVKGDFTAQGSSDNVFDKYGVDLNNFFIRGDDAGGSPQLQIRAQKDTGVGTAVCVAGASITVLNNQWNHVVVTCDTSAEEFKIYLNGDTTPASSTTISDGSWTPDGQNCRIGQHWLGSIDDVAIWSAILDADAVAAVYNSGKPFDLNYDRGLYDNASDLEAYWRMNDGSGTTVVDSSTNSHNGTLAAQATFGTDTPDD